jgi:hypothetical protein
MTSVITIDVIDVLEVAAPLVKAEQVEVTFSWVAETCICTPAIAKGVIKSTAFPDLFFIYGQWLRGDRQPSS